MRAICLTAAAIVAVLWQGSALPEAALGRMAVVADDHGAVCSVIMAPADNA